MHIIKVATILSILYINVFAKNITVAVSANASYVIEELISKFNKLYPDITVKTVLGSSGKLTAQISHNAPIDLFISADMSYPQSLYKNSFALSPAQIYAIGEIAIFSTKGFDLGLGLEILKNPKIKKIAIANPKTAPYGKATIQALKNAKIYNLIKDKLVYAESIAQTISYTILVADIGIVALSSLCSKNMKKYKKNTHYKKINPNLYTPIKQGIVMLRDNKETKKFYDFILSKDAKKIFQKNGYMISDD